MAYTVRAARSLPERRTPSVLSATEQLEICRSCDIAAILPHARSGITGDTELAREACCMGLTMLSVTLTGVVAVLEHLDALTIWTYLQEAETRWWAE